MNKNFYRIIFNARRGIRMAVAETAASQGKSASGETGATATHRPCWTLTAFASLIALNCLLDSGLQAQVIADRSAPIRPPGRRPAPCRRRRGFGGP